MLLRLLSRNRLVKTSQAFRYAFRPISTTKVAMGGGGGHHHEPLPVYIPKPGSLEWSVCGRPGVKRISTNSEYAPGRDDYFAYFGAIVGIFLTISAVAVYTDTFSKEDKHADHKRSSNTHHKKEEHSKDSSQPPEKKETPQPAASEKKGEIEKDEKSKSSKEDKTKESKSKNDEEKTEEQPKKADEQPKKPEKEKPHKDEEKADEKPKNEKKSEQKEKPKSEEEPKKDGKSRQDDKPKKDDKSTKSNGDVKPKNEEKHASKKEEPSTNDDKSAKPTKKDQNPREEIKSDSQQKPDKNAAKKKEDKEISPENKPPKQKESYKPPSGTLQKESADEKPSTSSNEKGLEKVEYLIVGSGTAAYYASLAIRARHADAKVVMIGEELHRPYSKPQLSKELWWYGGNQSSQTFEYTALSGKKRDIYYEVEGFYIDAGELDEAKHGGVSLISGRKVVKLCTKDKVVMLDDGSHLLYDKLLLATGSRPQRLELFDKSNDAIRGKTTYYHTADDYKTLEQKIADGKVGNLTIVGGGLLASELAYSIKRRHENLVVHQVLEGDYNAKEIFPSHLSKKASESLEKMGVLMHRNQQINDVKANDNGLSLKLKGDKVETDFVVIALGTEPNVDVAEASGIATNKKFGGIEANGDLKVEEDVWAAGDVVCFNDKLLGTRRVEHWEHAQISGRLAGENMVGPEKPFWYQPSFFTKFAPNFHINAVGRVDSSLPTVTVFAEKSPSDELDRAVVFYKGEDDKVVGVVLLNVFGLSLDVARRIIDDAKPMSNFQELAKLFPLYELPQEDVSEHKASHE